MSYVPLSTSFPMFDNWGPSKPRGYRDGCWPCRFRRKRCEPGLAGPEGPCEACSTFNMICCGRGIDRPPGHELATQLRALMTAWMRNTANRGPFVPPLDLTLVTLSVSPIVNSANYQHWDDTPIPLFPEVEAHNSHQGNTAGSAPSRNHEDTICPLDTEASWYNTQSGFHIRDHKHHTQPPPPPTASWTEYLFACFPTPIRTCIFGFITGSKDHVTPTSYHDEKVLSLSPGAYDPFSTLGTPSSGTSVTGERLQSPYGPNDGMRLPSCLGHR